MSEFKKGDKVRQKAGFENVNLVNHWKECWGKEKPTDGTFFIIQEKDNVGDVQYNTDNEKHYGPYVPSKWLELVKPAEPEITEGSLWIHESLHIVVEVELIGSNGRYGLCVKEIPEGYEPHKVGDAIIFTGKDYTFLEAYKPYAPEQKTVKLEKWICIQQFLHDGVVGLDDYTYDSEEEARREWVDGLGSYRLLDVIKIEWEGEIPSV